MSAENIVNETVQQGRNGGTIKRGNVGNKGGTGKPPSEIRERCRGSFDERIKILEDIAENGSIVADKLKAIDLLGKYGGLQRVDVTSDDEVIRSAHPAVSFVAVETPDVRALVEALQAKTDQNVQGND